MAYDEVTVTVADWNGQPLGWDGVIVNNAYYELPSTGGPGTILYTAGGLLLLLAAVVLGLHKHTAHRKGDSISP